MYHFKSEPSKGFGSLEVLIREKLFKLKAFELETKGPATYDEVVKTYNVDENVKTATYKMTEVIEGDIKYLMSVHQDYLLWFKDESPVEWTKEKRFAQIKTSAEEVAQFYLLFMSENGQIKAVFKMKLDQNSEISESTNLIQKVPYKIFGLTTKPKRLTVKDIVDFIKKDTFTVEKSAVTAANIAALYKYSYNY